MREGRTKDGEGFQGEHEICEGWGEVSGEKLYRKTVVVIGRKPMSRNPAVFTPDTEMRKNEALSQGGTEAKKTDAGLARSQFEKFPNGMGAKAA